MNPANYLKTKILIAEDARAVRNLEINMLKDMGYETIIEAEDGQAAINILQSHTDIELVISDWNMPNKTGFDLLVWMRNNDACKDIPFIMATGQGEKKKVQKAKDAGANNFVTKPFSPMDLKQVVESTLKVLDIQDTTVLKRDLKKTSSGKTKLTIAHIPITDHVVLGALKHLITTGDFTPKHFELETKRMMLWNPVQVALEKGEVDGVFILAPIAMDLFSFGMPIKLVLLAHKNGSICVKNKGENTSIAHEKALHNYFNQKTVYLPHLLSIHHVLSTMFFRELGLNPGLSDNPQANVYFEVIPPIKMPDFQAKDKDVGGFMVAEPVGTKAIATGVGDLMYTSSELWPNHPCCVIVLRDDIIEFDPDAVQEFVDMAVLAGKFVSEHPEQSAKIAVDFLDPDKTIGLKAPIIEKVLSSEDRIITDDLYPNITDLNHIQTYMHENMDMGTLIDMEKFVDCRFADMAYKSVNIKKRPSVLPDSKKLLSTIIQRITPKPRCQTIDTPEIQANISNIFLNVRSSPFNAPCTYLAYMHDTADGCQIIIYEIKAFDMASAHYTHIVKKFMARNSNWAPGKQLFDNLNAFFLDKNANAAITGLIVDLNTKTRTAEIISAAAPPVILFRKYIPQAVNLKGRPLGIAPQVVLDRKTLSLDSGHRLFFHNQGIIQLVQKYSRSKKKQKLHYSWLDDLLLKHGNAPLDEMINSLWEDLLSQCQNRLDEDLLLVGLEVL